MTETSKTGENPRAAENALSRRGFVHALGACAGTSASAPRLRTPRRRQAQSRRPAP